MKEKIETVFNMEEKVEEKNQKESFNKVKWPRCEIKLRVAACFTISAKWELKLKRVIG